jgi:hypothetical protein
MTERLVAPPIEIRMNDDALRRGGGVISPTGTGLCGVSRDHTTRAGENLAREAARLRSRRGPPAALRIEAMPVVGSVGAGDPIPVELTGPNPSTQTCQMSPVLFLAASRMMLRVGVTSSGWSKNWRHTPSAWRLKRAKLTPSPSGAPGGRGHPIAPPGPRTGSAAAPAPRVAPRSVVRGLAIPGGVRRSRMLAGRFHQSPWRILYGSIVPLLST